MERRKLALFALFTSLAAGCATSPVALKDAKPVAADRLYAYQTPGVGSTASVSVMRDSGMGGSACYIALWVNQTLVARLNPAEVATINVQPGEVLLRAGDAPGSRGLCALGNFGWKQYEAVVHPGEHKVFRLITLPGGYIDITRAEINH